MILYLKDGSFWKRAEISMAQVQVNYQTKEWYIVVNVSKYRSNNLIIFYYCIYSGLSGTIRLLFETL